MERPELASKRGIGTPFREVALPDSGLFSWRQNSGEGDGGATQNTGVSKSLRPAEGRGRVPRIS